jgi:hypothetical protein
MSEEESQPDPQSKRSSPHGDWHHQRRHTKHETYAHATEIEFRRREELRSDPGPATTTGALFAYRCGAIGLIPGLGAVLGPIAVIAGLLSLRYIKTHPTVKGTGYCVAGMVMGLIGTVVGWVIVLVIMAMISASNVHK